VSGRTATAVDIKIVKVGQNIPKLLRRQQGKVANTPGFEWYVSRHYALKSQMPEKFSRHILEVSELAYPFNVWISGFKPKGIDEARMAIVYAKTRKDVDRSVRSDLDSFWAGSGGGVTLNANCVAYNYPSGGLMYHKRDLVVHENFHMHVMNSGEYKSPAFREFITIAGANHVYDEKKKQLTLFVVDKATTNNPYDSDLAAMRSEFADIKDVMTTSGKRCKMLGIQFFLTDPDRLMKWRLWRDESVGHDDHERLLEEICGPLNDLNDEWRKWVAARTNTFHYYDWGWEQNGNTLWSYGWPQKGPHSRTDVNMPPGEAPRYDPLVMDYPAIEKPEIVGEVARGVAEPSVGCVIDFSRNPGKGRAGLGLGVIEGPPLSFPEGSIFTDRSGKTPGLNVAAYKLGQVRGEGMKSSQVASGALIAESVDPGVRLGGEGSATKGLKENFVVELKGFFRTPRAGKYVFATASDDGSWLWVDGREVVSNGGPHGIVFKTGEARLSGGMHELRVRFYQGGGGYGMSAGIVTGDGPGYATVLVRAEKELLIECTDLGLGKKAFPLPGDLVDAMKRNGHRAGMNIKVARRSLDVTLRAGAPGKMATFAASLPINDKARRRLLEKPLSILARDGYHGVTPFFDDRRRMPPDLTVPAPPNRWRFAGLDELYGLYRARFRLKAEAPRSLLELQEKVLATVDAPPDAQRRAMELYGSRISRVARDVRTAAAGDEELADACLADLAGARLDLRVADTDARGALMLSARVAPPLAGRAEGALHFEVSPAGAAVEQPRGKPLQLDPGEPVRVKSTVRVADGSGALEVSARAELRWQGEKLRLRASRSLFTSVPRWWIVGPFANPGGWEKDVSHAVETEPLDLAKEYAGAGDARIRWRKVERGADLAATDEHFIDLAELMSPSENVAAYALAWLVSSDERDAVLAAGSDDALVVWLNDERVHEKLVGRGYTAREDRVPIHLKKGRNKLMLKVTQGDGGWNFCAHLEDARGGPLLGVTTSLDPDG
jgi:hypothetical protein